MEVKDKSEKKKEYKEELNEHILPIDDLDDELIRLFLKLHDSMPELDHVTANQRIKSQGILKRILDAMPSFSREGKETLRNNIFAPTAALALFKKFH